MSSKFLVQAGVRACEWAQALFVTWLEAVMLGGEHGEELDGTTIYPPILVLITSGLGVVMAHRLASAQGLDATSAWLLRLLHLSKLSLILIPQARPHTT